jgi:hypothetical protein
MSWKPCQGPGNALAGQIEGVFPMLYFVKDKVSSLYYPSEYKEEDYELPSDIKNDWNKLNAQIEHKYTREYLKVCAFYNKVFPSLKSYDWSFSSHNALPFTIFDQERNDTGTGMSVNYLKSCIDTVVSRISNLSFGVALESIEPLATMELFKAPVERHIRSTIRKNRLDHVVTECFHDAAILGYSHLLADPWTKEIRKVSDWELGVYEPEFNAGKLKRVLIRDFAFPSAALEPYLKNYSDKDKLEEWSRKTFVDIKWYYDCPNRKATATIDTVTMEPIDYPFDEVQLTTFSWDLGVKRTTVASLFDQLFPLQREISKLMAKQTQLLSNYKGPVPVFNTQDADAVLKAINNSAGEALFIDGRSPSEFMTVINPVPLDPAFATEVEGLKSRMYEIAGIQEISMDMENYRSAAAVIALDQMRDAKYQNQLFLMAEFVSAMVKMYLTFNAGMDTPTIEDVPWYQVVNLVDNASVKVKVYHPNDPGGADEETPMDYMTLAAYKFIKGVLKGEKTFSDLTFTVDKRLTTVLAAQKYQRLAYLDVGSLELETFLVEAFIDDVKNGVVMLNG